MERSEILATMGELKLYGMKAAFDEIIATAVKRQHEPQRVVGDLLTAEISEKQARSIKYQITIAKLPLAKDIDDFRFGGTPSTRPWYATSSAATSWRISATSCWSAVPARARVISLSQSLAPAFVAVPEAGSSMSSIWSTSWKPKHARDVKDAWPTIFAARTSSSSTNSAICRSRKQAGNCCSTWSAASMSKRR